MKLILAFVVICFDLFGRLLPEQGPELSKKLDALTAVIERQSRLLEQQANQLERMHTELVELKAQAPIPHRKSVAVLLKVLTVVDHTGSVASIYSVVPHHF